MSDEQELQDAMLSQYEFKQFKFGAPSKGRMALILGYIDTTTPGPFDVHVFIFGCIAPVSALLKGRRDKAWFDKEVFSWVEKNIEDGDLQVEADIMKRVMAEINVTRAVAIDDGTTGLESGNLQSQQDLQDM